MAKVTVGLPQGTRDFGPEVVRKRNYILNTIRNVFELYGFQPLETPAMENMETLMGKYGEEGDKLIYRILDSGNPFDKDFYDAVLDIDFYNTILGEDFLNELTNGMKNKLQLYEVVKKSKNLESLSIEDYKKNLTDAYNEILEKKAALPKLKKETSSKALRYDLTIPFARFVAMNHNQLTFPFKRYQIQPVWRADRPQKGRYREFYQCDADIVGSNALMNEVELAIIYATVFKKLGIDVDIKINSRKILEGLAESVRFGGYNLDGSGTANSVSNKSLGETAEMINISAAIDKLDKVGMDGVKKELSERGLNDSQIKSIENYLQIEGSNKEKITRLQNLFGNSNMPDGIRQGTEEIEFILERMKGSIYENQIKVDFTLARGLNYYTGIIFEVKANNVQMGSIGGGGRYDDLTGLFGVPNIPGVGISFGVDRIYDVMEGLEKQTNLKLFPEEVHIGTQVLFFNLGDHESKTAFTLMQQLRDKGIRSELFHEKAKEEKQYKYAEKKNIPFVIIIGSAEIENKNCVIKDIRDGKKQTLSFEKLIELEF